ncbi:MAG: permease prefix domain 1-containing protein, partial [Candidatus Helarchaeota archaeon]
MIEIREKEELIEEFLDKIKQKLPFWLKSNEDELREVLRELKEHILDSAEVLEQKGEAPIEAVRTAIFQMGNPSKIANEYKRRGTPKFYITEELWPTYLAALKVAGLIVGLVIAGITLVNALIIGLTGGDWVDVIFAAMSNLFILTLIIVTGISVLFVWLSYEGYFPEDIKNFFKSKGKLGIKVHKLLEEAHKGIEGAKAERVVEIEEKEQKIEEVKEEVKETENRGSYPKWLDKPISLIIGGVFPLVFGILAVIQPFAQLKALLNPQFLSILFGFGIFWIVLGFLEITQGFFVSWSYPVNKVLYPTRAIIELATIPFLAYLLVNPQIFPLFFWDESTGFVILEIAVEYYWVYY